MLYSQIRKEEVLNFDSFIVEEAKLLPPISPKQLYQLSGTKYCIPLFSFTSYERASDIFSFMNIILLYHKMTSFMLVKT